MWGWVWEQGVAVVGAGVRAFGVGGREGETEGGAVARVREGGGGGRGCSGGAGDGGGEGEGFSEARVVELMGDGGRGGL